MVFDRLMHSLGTGLFALLIGTGVLGVSLPGTAHAQQDGEAAGEERAGRSAVQDTIVRMQEISIEASRLTETERSAPFSVTVYERSETERQLTATTSLTDALGTLPGVWMNDRENAALGERLAVRGFGAQAEFGVRGVQVLLDGIPLTMPDGQAFLNIVDPAFLREAEVIRGPASTFWGNGSGGVLALETSAYPDELRARARSMVGSYGMRKFEGEVGVPIGSHRVRAYVSHLRSDGFRHFSRVERTWASAFSRWDLGPRTNLRVIGAFVNSPQTEHPGSLTREQARESPRMARPDFQENRAGKTSRQGQFGAHLSRQTSLGLLSATGYGLFRQVDNPLPFAYIWLRRTGGGLRAQIRDRIGPWQWGVGADAGRQHDRRKNFDTVAGDPGDRIGQPGDELSIHQVETVTDGALFARVARQLGRTRLSAGLRYDRIRFAMDDRYLENDDQTGSRSFDHLSPTLGVSHRAGPLTVYLNASTSFETPTTTELVNRPDLTGGFNQQLEPKRSRGLEGGIRGTAAAGRFGYDLTVYGYRVTGLLIRQERSDGRAYYQNRGTTRKIGVEGRLSWRPVRSLEAVLSTTHSSFEFTSGPFEGNQIPAVPSSRADARLTWSPGPIFLRASTRAVAEYEVNNENTAHNDPYAVLDLHAGYRDLDLGGLTLRPFVSVQNVTNARYNGSVIPNTFGGRYYEPAADRTVRVGLNVDFGG